MKKVCWLLLMTAVLLMLCGSVLADYPFSSVTMIIPYGAGGTTDLVGRKFAAAMGKVLGTTFVCENQGGASGSIGCQAALDAAKDGSVVLFTAESLGTQRVMDISKLSYADFSPIMAVSYTGPGGSGHVQALIMNQYNYFPALTAYSGGSDCYLAVMSNQVVFTNSNYSTVASYIESGDLKLLAIAGTERMAQYPDVPALAEKMENSEALLSIPYTPLSLLVAKDVPADIQEQLRNAALEAVKDPDFVSFMEKNNIEKLYEKYPTIEDIKAFYTQWESTVSWLLYDANAASFSPEEFGIAKP